MSVNDKYFTSPSGEVNYCNECKQPIKETEGRFHVNIDYDFYFNFRRHTGMHGYKTFCDKCFHKLFDKSWENSESIYKKS